MVVVVGLLLAACGSALAPDQAAVRFYRLVAAGLAGDDAGQGLDVLAYRGIFEETWGEEGYECKGGDDAEALFWAMMADQGGDSLLHALAVEVAFCPHRSAADLAEAINDGVPQLPPSDLREHIAELMDVAE